MVLIDRKMIKNTKVQTKQNSVGVKKKACLFGMDRVYALLEEGFIALHIRKICKNHKERLLQNPVKI